MTGRRTILRAGLAAALLLVAPAPAGADDVRARVRAFVAERAGVPASAVEVPRLAAFELPGSPEVKLSVGERERFRGPTAVTVVLHRGGEEIKRGVVTVNVERRERVLVAARALPARTRIGPDDVRVASVDARAVPRGAVHDRTLLVGRQTTRSVAAGTPWRSTLVADVPAVARGETVRMRLGRGPLRIETMGRAREEGAEGDSVRVLNLRSRREVVGIVAEAGVVHVPF